MPSNTPTHRPHAQGDPCSRDPSLKADVSHPAAAAVDWDVILCRASCTHGCTRDISLPIRPPRCHFDWTLRYTYNCSRQEIDTRETSG